MTRYRIAIGRTLAAMALLALAACGGGERPRVYALDPSFALEARSRPALPGVLQVPPLTSPQPYAARPLAWRDMAVPYEVRHMDDRLWAETPPRLLQGHVRQCLERAAVAERVLPDGIAVEIDFLLNGEIERFELQVTDGVHKAVLAANFVLSRRKPRALLWQGRIATETTARDSSAAATLAAFTANVESLCQELAAALSQPFAE